MNPRTTKGPRLCSRVLPFTKTLQTDQQRTVDEFRSRVGDVENFLILIQTKDGFLQVIPCLDSDVGILEYLEAFKSRIVTQTIERLESPTTRGRAG